jgi:UDP-N-acetyl-2-amino-2-deoxyglucuronate dehydrogenase
VRLALRNGADAICEKPLVINPWNLDQLEELEQRPGRRFTVLQLRLHPSLLALKARLEREARLASRPRHLVSLTYITVVAPGMTRRGRDSREVWWGVDKHWHPLLRSLALVVWLMRELQVHLSEFRRMAGRMKLDCADVNWLLS